MLNTEKQAKRIIIVFLVAISLLFLQPHSLFGKSEEAMTYRDDNNGYFFFVPPKEWTIEKYHDPRTKVAFHHPKENNVVLRFIVKEIQLGYTFSELKRDAEEVSRQWRTKGIIFKLEETEILGVKGITLSSNIPNLGYIRISKTIKFGIHFNITFSTPSKAKFQKYLNDVTQAINSIVVLKPTSLDPEKAKRQQIGNYIRSAELISLMGNNEEACNILKELIREFPENKNIKAMLNKLQCK